ncbi:MAG: PAS domain-containing sensor histidine kinase [bacterium]|nr:PAS domain-containing sensor histidine kinase [bacterium]
MHPSLERAIAKYMPDGLIPPEYKEFISVIDRAYIRSEEDRTLIERSLELASKELNERNKALKQKKQEVELEVIAKTKELHEKVIDLAEVNAKTELVFNSMGEALIAFDPTGKVLFFNERAHTMFALTPSVVGLLWTDIFTLEDKNSHPISIELALMGKTPHSENAIYEPLVYLVAKNGKRIPVAITSAPLIVGDHPQGWVTLFRDIKADLEIDQAKTEFVSLASHQMRTPLTAIKGYTSMLLEGDGGEISDKQRIYLAAIERSNNRMVDLINALLNASRIELGVFAIEPKPINIVEVADIAITELNVQIVQREIVFSKNYTEVPNTINADPHLTKIIFQNLISNAIKYTPKGGAVSLSLSGTPNGLSIEVSDTGIGIPKNEQSKIFTKLFRADNARITETEGTGLGLYIVKSVVEESGGEIFFESEENKGTRFFVSLPVSGMKQRKGTRGLQ